ncbi:Putative undecaprenyl-diphosphatase YbjG [Bacillus sp. THAF10]|uniref:phosphatase PAP2 family protein n=1 Tax=Bacillus sp. THAF10 TaxID=2587848 RepID=UPI001267CAE6|nr:phosphatase PAP2 family protein [Bacillus sp. THAF10]QFT88478.1 Putative undecaprenyl-diphosphatase YbjG [Bacillus sp. THAF10]
MDKRHVMIKYKPILLPSFLVLLGLCFMFTAGGLFAELAEDVLEKEKFLLDEITIHYFETIENNTLTSLFTIITELGSIWVISTLTIVVALFLWLKKHDRIHALFIVIASAGGGLFVVVLKYFFQRERPTIAMEYDGSGYSFPSGHALGSFILYGFIVYLLAKEQKQWKLRLLFIVLLSLLILSIGLSRVYLTVHYPTDILAGYSLGLIWLLSCIFAAQLWKLLRQ